MRQGGSLGAALGFFLAVVAFLPLGLGPDPALLQRIAPGALWIALLLSVLLSADLIFRSDFDDGSLEVMATGTMPLEVVVLIKAAVHWLTTSLPLALAAPVAGLLLNMEPGRFRLRRAGDAGRLADPVALCGLRRRGYRGSEARRSACIAPRIAHLCAGPDLRSCGEQAFLGDPRCPRPRRC